MASPRREHLKRERRERRRSRKLTVYDRLVPSFALAAWICLIAGILFSWKMGGQAAGGIGAVGWIGLLLAIGAVLLGYMTKNARQVYLPYIRMGVWPGMIAIIVYVILLVAGTR
jgi:lipopolysaccharide export LptBFGC system permease protein LptF